jgi:hypothetical protein
LTGQFAYSRTLKALMPQNLRTLLCGGLDPFANRSKGSVVQVSGPASEIGLHGAR